VLWVDILQLQKKAGGVEETHAVILSPVARQAELAIALTALRYITVFSTKALPLAGIYLEVFDQEIVLIGLVAHQH
jgi:hypothetical protein